MTDDIWKRDAKKTENVTVPKEDGKSQKNKRKEHDLLVESMFLIRKLSGYHMFRNRQERLAMLRLIKEFDDLQ